MELMKTLLKRYAPSIEHRGGKKTFENDLQLHNKGLTCLGPMLVQHHILNHRGLKIPYKAYNLQTSTSSEQFLTLALCHEVYEV